MSSVLRRIRDYLEHPAGFSKATLQTCLTLLDDPLRPEEQHNPPVNLELSGLEEALADLPYAILEVEGMIECLFATMSNCRVLDDDTLYDIDCARERLNLEKLKQRVSELSLSEAGLADLLSISLLLRLLPKHDRLQDAIESMILCNALRKYGPGVNEPEPCSAWLISTPKSASTPSSECLDRRIGRIVSETISPAAGVSVQRVTLDLSRVAPGQFSHIETPTQSARQAEEVAPGWYSLKLWDGTAKNVYCRVVGATVMVRVGGGYQELKSFLQTWSAHHAPVTYPAGNLEMHVSGSDAIQRARLSSFHSSPDRRTREIRAARERWTSETSNTVPSALRMTSREASLH
ncbi:hypothetical protein PYCC9005_005385 [Savitreella phatthalungensis]